MNSKLHMCLFGTAAYFALSSVAWAGTITAEGSVTPLDDITQVASVTGTALFDDAEAGEIPLDQYMDVGLTFHVGELTMVLPGVVELGEAINPRYVGQGSLFPNPIGGGGVALNSIVFYAGAATFADPITQFGLTAGGSSVQYITVWGLDGVMLGQVKWEPDEENPDAAFVGVDTMGVPIGMLTYGNDDVFNGETYLVTGDGSSSDNWIWGLGQPCASEADCFDDAHPCIVHACTDGACSYSPTTELCDDGDACSENDVCTDGLCGGSEVDCADTNVCTFDTCDSDDGCSSAIIEECCLSDEDCPENWMCLLGSNTCVEGPPPPPPPPGDGDGDEEETETEAETDTGAAADEGDGGCGCTAGERGGGALFGLLGLLVLGASGRRRR